MSDGCLQDRSTKRALFSVGAFSEMIEYPARCATVRIGTLAAIFTVLCVSPYSFNFRAEWGDLTLVWRRPAKLGVQYEKKHVLLLCQ